MVPKCVNFKSLSTEFASKISLSNITTITYENQEEPDILKE